MCRKVECDGFASQRWPSLHFGERAVGTDRQKVQALQASEYTLGGRNVMLQLQRDLGMFLPLEQGQHQCAG
jgi:hypothetical protein